MRKQRRIIASLLFVIGVVTGTLASFTTDAVLVEMCLVSSCLGMLIWPPGNIINN